MARGERETLLALQRALSEEQFQSLKFLLEDRLPLAELRPAARPDLCRLLLQHFPGRALHVAAALLRQIGRHDLLRLYQLPAEDETPGEKGNAAAAGSSGRGEDAGCPVPSPGALSPPSGALSPLRCLTEKELLQVAQKLGREWQEVGIACLGLEKCRLEQIREDNPHSAVLQSFEMLREWRRRERQDATVPRLRACLAPASLDPGIFDLLQSFQGD